MTAEEMRKSYEAYKEFTSKRDNGEWQEHRVFQWGAFRYVVTGTIKLVEEMQRLEVIDITDDLDVALFSNCWPESMSTRNYALIHHSAEGHDLILYESGFTSWVTYADLPIRVVNGTREDRKLVRSQQMDELEAQDGYGLSMRM